MKKVKAEMPHLPKGAEMTGAQAGLNYRAGGKGGQHAKMAMMQCKMGLHPGHTPPGKPHGGKGC